MIFTTSFFKLVPYDDRTSKVNLEEQDSKFKLLTNSRPAWGSTSNKKTSSDSAWVYTVNKYKINSLKISATIQWDSISNRTTPLFQRNSSIQINKISSTIHTITPC